MSLLNIKTSLVNNSSRSTVGTEVRKLFNEAAQRQTQSAGVFYTATIENLAVSTNILTDLQKIS